MNLASERLSDAKLHQQRDKIRRGLLRTYAAGVAILLIVVVLAVAALIAAWRADRNARTASEASHQAQQQRMRAERELWKSRLAEASALRLSGEAGRRSRALNALREAARLQPDAVVRDEVVASLALTDLEPEGPLRPIEPAMPHAVDERLEYCALGQTNGEVILHRFTDNGIVRRFTPPFEARTANAVPSRMQFDDQGARLAVVYDDGRWALFDVKAIRPAQFLSERAFAGPETREPLAFSADGNWFGLIGSRGQIHVYGLREGIRLVTTIPSANLRAIAFHPQDPWLAIGSGAQARIVDWQKGETLTNFNSGALVHGLRFRPDGKQLAVAAGEVGLTLWNLQTGEPTRLSLPTGAFYELHYSPSGHYVSAALGEGVSRIWDAHTGELLHKLVGARVSRFGADGQRLAVERPREGLSLLRFSPAEGFRLFRWVREHAEQQRFWCADVSDDNRWLAAVDNRHLVVWDVATETVIATNVSSRRLTVAWLEQRHAWLTGGQKGLSIWPIETNSATGRVALGREQSIPLSVHPSLGQATVAPDGHTAALVAQGGTALLLDLDDPSRQRKFEGPPSLGHLVFSPDGTRLASSSTDGSGLLVWEASTGELKQRVAGPHGRVAWSPDGRWLVLGAAREYGFWDTTLWQKDDGRTLSRGNLSDTTGAVAYSRDGRLLAVARNRELAQLIDAVSGAQLASLTAPTLQGISWLNFSSDGDRLAAATFEGTVQLWDLRALRQRLAEFRLDWNDSQPATIEAAREDSSPTQASTFTGLIVLTLVGVVLALGAALFGFQRHRYLLRGYLQVDALAARRAKELELAQVEIGHSQKMKALGTLAAGIAHDFNNLLSVIRMSNQLTRETARGNVDVQENADEVENAVQQGKKIVRSMLGYSRHQPEEVGAFALAEAVENTVALLSKQFLSGITLTLELDPNSPQIVGSRSKLEQILLNLVVNASEAMGGQGHLSIAVHKHAAPAHAYVLRPAGEGALWELMVADSGSGIQPHVLPRIFEPFFTTKTIGATRGTGLGLSMVYTMCEQEGWGIAVETEPQHGTRFRVIIPIQSQRK